MIHTMRREQLDKMQELLGRKGTPLVVHVNGRSPSAEPALPFHIRTEQQILLGESMKRRFISKALRILPQLVPGWGGEGKSEVEKVVLIEDTIGFAASYKIYQEDNVIKLLSWRQQYMFRIPLIPELEFILGRKQLSEGYRVERFYEAIVSRPLIPLSLEEEF